VALFKAIEVDAATRQRTGRQHLLEADNRQAAIQALLELLDVAPEQAWVDPSRTMVQVETRLWTLVAMATSPSGSTSASLRRGGAKHKHVRD
jgi:hypothetical protein